MGIEKFFNENPEFKSKVVVHHAVDQQVLKKYSGLFTQNELDNLKNWCVIPKDMNNTLHLSKIRKTWHKFYKKYPNATKQNIKDFAKVLGD